MRNLENILRQQISLLGMVVYTFGRSWAGSETLALKFILPNPLLEISQAFVRDAKCWLSQLGDLKVNLLGFLLGVIIACLRVGSHG